MKKILLIGDSIRAGYDWYVKKAFAGLAEVYFPSENCRFTTYIIRQLSEWKKQLGIGGDVDLVHWNAGLWDTLVALDGKHLIPFAFYQENVERICHLIRLLFPKAKMIFATSTPVQETLYVDYKRYNRDIVAYNAAAVEVVKRYGGKINDLYGLMKQAPVEYYSDATHFYTRLGTEYISKQVIRFIEKELQMKGCPLDYDSLFTIKETVVGI